MGRSYSFFFASSSHKEKEIAHKVEETLTNAADTLSKTVKGVTNGVKQAANDMKQVLDDIGIVLRVDNRCLQQLSGRTPVCATISILFQDLIAVQIVPNIDPIIE